MSETEDEQDNVPLHIAFKTVKETKFSEDSEGDEVPIAQTIRQKTKESDIWVPTAQTRALLLECRTREGN